MLKYALLGIASGLIATASSIPQSFAEEAANSQSLDKATPSEQVDKNAENEGYHLMSESELKGLLNKKSRELFDSLDPAGKTLAIQVASGRCDGTNLCAGLNACESPTNSCAGQSTCKGKGKCAFANKNLAIQLVAKKIAEKRKNVVQPQP